MRKRVPLLLLATLALPALAQNEPAAAPRRPTIGLALGGGGARGFAHIGVLQWFEEHRIPIDYIAGTSMGGLVGGLYAIGMTAPEMRELLAGLNWNDLFKDSPSYDQLSARRRDDEIDTPNALELGFRDGVNLPGGLISGQKVGLLLSRMTLPVAHIERFDDLPVPFRCVATDMTAAQPVVLSEGSLAAALRATMAIPGVFSPIEINGKVLADGGLLNNVPTDVVKAMGADIVIAVDIGTPLGDRESVQTLIGVVNQAFAVMMANAVRENLRLADVLLSPDLEGYSSGSFTSSEAIADLGYQGTQKKAAVLTHLGVDAETYRAYRAQIAARRGETTLTPTFLDVRGTDRVPPRVIEERLEGLLGEPLEPTRVEDTLTKLYGEGYYARIGYNPVHRNGEVGLVIGVQEKRYGPPFLRLHADFAGGTRDETQFGLFGRLTTNGLTGYGSEWRSDLVLGRRNRLATEYYQPIRETGFFAAPRAWYQTWRNDLFIDDLRAAEYRSRELGMGLDAGYQFSTSARLRGGLAIGTIDEAVIIGPPVRPKIAETFGYARLGFTNDRRDNVSIPSRGVRIDTELRVYTAALGSDSEFTRLTGDLQWFQPLGENRTLFALADGGTTFDATIPPYGEFTLGGLNRLSAYRRDRFRGAHALRGALGYMQGITELPFLLGRRVYLGGMYELGGAFPSLDQARYYHSATLGLMADTLMGPAFIGYSFGEEGDNQVHFSIGRLF
ncbi:MAG: patatin-like phospholipase family protein [Armatimonadetes bacterium]|nr:patatin-like phospholipase family protein [Armatimonadota bacterium]